MNTQVIQGRREVSKGIGMMLVGVLIRNGMDMEMNQQSENGNKTLSNESEFRTIKNTQN